MHLRPIRGSDVAIDYPAVIVSWWVVKDHVDSALDAELAAFVPRWVTTDWPFSRPRYGV